MESEIVLPIWDNKTEAADVALALQEHIRGKNVLITGCTIGGLGFEAAKCTAQFANLVILAGSNADRLNAAKDSITSTFPDARIRILIVDLASFESVRHAARDVNAYPEPLHVLINNAAARIGPYVITKEGHESQFGVNHLAHFLFTALLYEKLLASGSPNFPPRVVTIASDGHRAFDNRGIHFDDLNFGNGKTYDNYHAYAQAKTANLLFMGELARRIDPKRLLSISVQPGAIWTNSSANTLKEDYIRMGAMDANGNFTGMFNWATMGSGAAKYLVAGFDPRLRDYSGAYITNDCQIHNEQIAPYASDPIAAKHLWELSEAIVHQPFLPSP
ncbi:NAD-P-binding protein [Clavulina sp. PMI_390]|nr:NAD-P-binding protein [Clavulina sp. PMI_390]